MYLTKNIGRPSTPKPIKEGNKTPILEELPTYDFFLAARVTPFQNFRKIYP